MKKTLMLIAGGLFGSLGAQDIHFSQYWMNPLHLSPALAGTVSDMHALAGYKSQWKSVTSPFRTFAGSFDKSLGKTDDNHWGLGAYIYHDQAGDGKLGTFQGSLHGAYHVKISGNSLLGAGVSLAYMQRSLSLDALQWESQYVNGSYSSSNPHGEAGNGSYGLFDIGAGLSWKYSRGNRYMTSNDHFSSVISISASHIGEPVYNFLAGESRLYRKYTGFGQFSFGIPGTKLSVEPSLAYTVQGRQQELLFGSMFRLQLREDSKYTGFVKGAAFSLGGHYRLKDAIVPSLMMEFGNYAVGMSYDLNISALTAASSGRGGFEIFLRFMNPNPFSVASSSSF